MSESVVMVVPPSLATDSSSLSSCSLMGAGRTMHERPASLSVMALSSSAGDSILDKSKVLDEPENNSAPASSSRCCTERFALPSRGLFLPSFCGGRVSTWFGFGQFFFQCLPSHPDPRFWSGQGPSETFHGEEVSNFLGSFLGLVLAFGPLSGSRPRYAPAALPCRRKLVSKLASNFPSTIRMACTVFLRLPCALRKSSFDSNLPSMFSPRRLTTCT